MRNHETQSRSESCVFSFSYPIQYTALHKCVLSTHQQCLLQLPIINNNNNNNNDNNNNNFTKAASLIRIPTHCLRFHVSRLLSCFQVTLKILCLRYKISNHQKEHTSSTGERLEAQAARIAAKKKRYLRNVLPAFPIVSLKILCLRYMIHSFFRQ